MFELKSSLEETFQSWSKPSSDSETNKCDNAQRMIKDAIKNSDVLNKYNIEIIPKGSYYNNTNVRLNSDVDIAVMLKDVFFASYPNGKSQNDFGNISSDYKFEEYRTDVEQAMIEKFGDANIEFGNKSIKVHSNSYRVDADVVPCFEHRRYSENGHYVSGTQFISKLTRENVTNFPKQHYTNGVNKNIDTSKRYKKVVRILKRLRYKMISDGYDFPNISSFLIESLVWNVPNKFFNNPSLTEDVKSAFDYLIEKTSNYDSCKDWGEVSDLLYLFNYKRKYNCNDVNKFLIDAYSYLF
ncbi:nucleotidyltransferase [Bacillus aerophilus]|uniref:nucleotidyltransferase domain-containing protein n=1 Tax=Bacillus altitudinis TaxID=293387 RepID=UPI0025AAB4D9|nr:nucleotidyltransferase [Bacillus aerophilus]